LFEHRGTAATTIAASSTHMSEMCENIKAAGIAVFTVGLQVTDSATVTRLRDCASRPEFAFDVQSVASLVNVFGEIAMSLRQLALGQ
jgi:hypothetical protein